MLRTTDITIRIRTFGALPGEFLDDLDDWLETYPFEFEDWKVRKHDYHPPHSEAK